MALLRTHSVTVYQPSDSVDGTTKVVEDVALDSGTVIQCMLMPTTATSAFEVWGLDVARPVRMYCSVSDSAKLAVGSRVAYGSRSFVVRAPGIKKFAKRARVDHTVALLEETTY